LATIPHADPRTGCFYARRALESAARCACKHRALPKLPHRDNPLALNYAPSFQ